MNKKVKKILIFLFLFIGISTTTVFAAEGDIYLKETNDVKYNATVMEENIDARNHVRTLPELFAIEVGGNFYGVTDAFNAYKTPEIGKEHWKHILILPDAIDLVENAETSVTQADLDKAQRLVNDLTIEVDKTDLQDRLDTVRAEINLTVAKINADQKVETDYTNTSWQTLKDALNLPEETVEEKIAKTDAINDAIELLAIKADLTEYNETLASVVEADYTEESWSAYQEVVTANVVTEDNIKAEAVAATAAIKDAQKDLVFVGQADLDAAIQLADSKTESIYTVSTWTAFSNAYTLAKELPETSNTEVVAKTVAINNAMNQLKERTTLTVTVHDTEVTYGEDPVFTVSHSGFNDGDNEDVLNGTLEFEHNYVNGNNAGTSYEVSTGGLSADDYTIEYKSGTLTVIKATYNFDDITFDNAIHAYDGKSKSLEVSGILPDGVTVNYENNGKVNADTYIVKAKFNGDAVNYELITNKAAELIINKAPITIIAEDRTSVYGQDLVDLTHTVGGSVYNNDDLDITLTKAGGITVGHYDITVSASNDNYDITLEDGTYTITKATYDMSGVSFEDATFTYNGQVHSLEISGTLPEDVAAIYESNDKIDAGKYTVTAKFSGDADNYEAIEDMTATLIIEKAKTTVDKIKINEDSFEISTESKLAERDYTDNAIKAAVFSDETAAEGKTLEKISLINIVEEIETDVTHQFTFKFYTDANKENEITELDLSKGGSTYKLYIDATDQSGNYYLSTQVIFKYKSVTRGATSTTYYTIEDALKEFSSGTVIVKHNTSFADADVAQEVYGGTRFEVKENVTLLLPHGYTYIDAEGVTKTNKYSASITDKFETNGTQAEITKNSSYVELLMPEGISLDVNGTLTVNAIRSGGTPTAGQIVGSNYSQIQMLENSKIIVNSGGKVNSIGFIYGHGSMEAKDGSTVIDSLLVTAFRGGTKTTIIYEEVFPFDQFSFHNIEVVLTINSGAAYDLSAIFSAGGQYVDTEAPLIGKNGSENQALISLDDGKIIKSFDSSTGKVILDFYSQSAQINDLTLDIVGYIACTEGKEMPFPGNFQLNVKAGSTITMNAGAKLLPGSGLYIEKDATAIITENGRLMVYDADEYIDITRGYPQNAKKYYRVEPDYDYSTTTPAKFILDGTLIVEGGLAGKVQTNTGGQIQIAPTASTQIEVHNMDINEYGVVPIIYNLKDLSGQEIHAKGKYRILTDDTWVTDITFHKNDGSGVEETITQTYGEDYIFPAWTDESIIWYSKSDGGDPLAPNKVKIVSQDLYARKEIITHTIFFDTNGGNPIDSYQVPTSSSMDLNFNYLPEKEGSIFLGWYTDDGFENRFDSSHVFTDDLTVYARWAKGSIKITLELDTIEIEKEGTIKVTAKFEDDNDPLKNLDIKFINTLGIWEDGSLGVSDSDGIVTKKFTSEHDVTMGFNFNDTISVREIFTGTQKSVKINIKAACPLIYSYDGEEYHLEHEPVPYSISKSFETTTHGTLRKLVEIDGKYYIRITEEMDSETFVNGVSLYAIDYAENSDIQGVFVDIFGNPHTIKEKVKPKAFIDSDGKDYLDAISTKGQFISSDSYLIGEGEYVESYEATFSRPENAGDMAKFMISVRANPMVDNIAKWFYDIMDGQNNIWWLDEALQSSPQFGKFIGAMNVATLQVELWNGSMWINQGEIAAGSTLLEEFLIPLDLSLIDNQTQDIKVRLTGGFGFFTIDQVSIDFSEDERMHVQRLELDSALKNETEEVRDTIDDFDNEERINLKTGEYIDLCYNAPELEEGYERGFAVDFKGYFQVVPNAKKNPLADTWENRTYEEIIDAVLAEQPEAANSLDTLSVLLELAEEIDGQSLEYKIEKIIAEQVIPWLRGD